MHGGDAGGAVHVDTGGHVAHVDSGSHFAHAPIHHDHGHHHGHDSGHHHHKHHHHDDSHYMYPPPPYYAQPVYGTMLPQHRARHVEIQEYTYDVSPAVQAFQLVLMVAIIGLFVFLVMSMATDMRFGGPGW
ncbi:hypothetical protein M409DRAFT_57709 [Zasmidium cellare ATCC 36951]|uniref:Uncharacterized protein n=1 Tax=Zasmidium cellare ATCC 36951 TaxID=1080233 RepID=A0A6A6C9X3_ZASCE|nr:uncharacterized protein M409DRAFT_57709 [Zasmidium cellare ATCC 36951]KAF2163030.1 hypothetical protein M409DRAFT_57709 [Zasmidium cellare ATCC 36951]